MDKLKALPFKEGKQIPYTRYDYVNACQFSKCDRFDTDANTVAWQEYSWVKIAIENWPNDKTIQGSRPQFVFCSIEHLEGWIRENK